MVESDEILTGKRLPTLDKLWGRRNYPLSQEEIDAFGRHNPSPPTIVPVVRYKDHNNQNERDILDCNPIHGAFETGIKISF